jgi:hypothetical protein
MVNMLVSFAEEYEQHLPLPTEARRRDRRDGLKDGGRVTGPSTSSMASCTSPTSTLRATSRAPMARAVCVASTTSSARRMAHRHPTCRSTATPHPTPAWTSRMARSCSAWPSTEYRLATAVSRPSPTPGSRAATSLARPPRSGACSSCSRPVKGVNRVWSHDETRDPRRSSARESSLG